MATRSMGKKKTKNKEKVELKKYLCPYCNKEKTEDKFYMSSDPLVMTGRCVMCIDCAEKIARNYDPNTKEFGDCTKTSVMQALERLDKPYLDNIWESSYFEVHDKSLKKPKSNIWAAYIKNISMQQYKTMRWRDGDIYSTFRERANANATVLDKKEVTVFKNDEIKEEYQKNRSDVIRLLGYDPFENEQEEDKPLLYSQLIGYLDLGGDNDDMMRTSSAITIVRGFLQQSKIDDMIAHAMAHVGAEGKAGEIKSYLDSKQKISSTISQLAEQSCLSLKHNKNSSKGENTWTGIVRKLKEMDLRSAEVNAFDIGTCEGMRQVADISNASIIKQIRLDENDYTEMLAQQRDMIVKLKEKADKSEEAYRILLRENVDLKKYIEENGIDISKFCTGNLDFMTKKSDNPLDK